jgi:hypothetical protein
VPAPLALPWFRRCRLPWWGAVATWLPRCARCARQATLSCHSMTAQHQRAARKGLHHRRRRRWAPPPRLGHSRRRWGPLRACRCLCLKLPTGATRPSSRQALRNPSLLPPNRGFSVWTLHVRFCKLERLENALATHAALGTRRLSLLCGPSPSVLPKSFI